MFKVNVGRIDRLLRILVGVVLIALVFVGPQVGLPIGNWGWIGIIPLLTGLFRMCPLYSLIGVDTCSAK